jgi:hypothetical protein
VGPSQLAGAYVRILSDPSAGGLRPFTVHSESCGIGFSARWSRVQHSRGRASTIRIHRSMPALVRIALLGGTYVLTGSAAVIVRGQVGARELGFAGRASMLGVSAPTAMAFALVPRAAQLILAAAGLMRFPLTALWRNVTRAQP